VYWFEGPLAALDLEATGVDPSTARIIEVGLFLFETDGSSTPLTESLVDPGVEIPEKVTELTGISPADIAATGSEPRQVLAEAGLKIAGLVDAGIPIVVYHATYDWPLLETELVRHGLGPLPAAPPAVLIDPLVLDRYVDRYRKGKRTLSDVASHYGVRLDGAHRAEGDCAATVAVARRIGEQHPSLHLDGAELVDLQVTAHATWRDSFNAYLAKVGASRPPITEDWPYG
jgi:DNA polymerase-3 subunit epsilon